VSLNLQLVATGSQLTRQDYNHIHLVTESQIGTARTHNTVQERKRELKCLHHARMIVDRVMVTNSDTDIGSDGLF
jgi:hypothetical protein